MISHFFQAAYIFLDINTHLLAVMNLFISVMICSDLFQNSIIFFFSFLGSISTDQQFSTLHNIELLFFSLVFILLQIVFYPYPTPPLILSYSSRTSSGLPSRQLKLFLSSDLSNVITFCCDTRLLLSIRTVLSSFPLRLFYNIRLLITLKPTSGNQRLFSYSSRWLT